MVPLFIAPLETCAPIHPRECVVIKEIRQYVWSYVIAKVSPPIPGEYYGRQGEISTVEILTDAMPILQYLKNPFGSTEVRLRLPGEKWMFGKFSLSENRFTAIRSLPGPFLKEKYAIIDQIMDNANLDMMSLNPLIWRIGNFNNTSPISLDIRRLCMLVKAISFYDEFRIYTSEEISPHIKSGNVMLSETLKFDTLRGDREDEVAERVYKELSSSNFIVIAPSEAKPLEPNYRDLLNPDNFFNFIKENKLYFMLISINNGSEWILAENDNEELWAKYVEIYWNKYKDQITEKRKRLRMDR